MGRRRPLTTQQAALDELTRMIGDGEFPPGGTIPVDDVARDFGMSRIPVREALKILEGRGLVTHRPHRGYVVTRLTPEELRELYDIRGLLESEAMRRAVLRAGEEDRERARAAFAATQRALDSTDRHGYTEETRRFHRALVEPCGMPRLLDMLTSVWHLTVPYRAVGAVDDARLRLLHAEHARILDAFVAGDVGRLLAESDVHREHLHAAALRATGFEDHVPR
jgi:DNA-binding GntR family transcriptional regulator